jgi:hypothetical protein
MLGKGEDEDADRAVVRTCMGAGPNWPGCLDWAHVCRSLEWVSDYAGGRDDQTEGRGLS